MTMTTYKSTQGEWFIQNSDELIAGPFASRADAEFEIARFGTNGVFLKQVALDLVAAGYVNPTPSQIETAMLLRLDRNAKLGNWLFNTKAGEKARKVLSAEAFSTCARADAYEGLR